MIWMLLVSSSLNDVSLMWAQGVRGWCKWYENGREWWMEEGRRRRRRMTMKGVRTCAQMCVEKRGRRGEGLGDGKGRCMYKRR